MFLSQMIDWDYGMKILVARPRATSDFEEDESHAD
jgi:hypothetical protein